uniref:SEP domain-containing protein n=1 Tax=Heterorhabditis bacteriophora TaxID=37862 RepID=A0A1I7XTB0_HETBA
MCKMWQNIRYGVRWNPSERLALAIRGMDLKSVKNIEISLDPFHPGNQAIRYVMIHFPTFLLTQFFLCRTFWHSVMTPKVRQTNPTLKVKADIRNDRHPPFFVAILDNGKKLHFNTENMHSMDLIMRFNRLLGNPELGKAGTQPKLKL